MFTLSMIYLDNWPRYVFENFTVKIVKIAKNINMCILSME